MATAPSARTFVVAAALRRLIVDSGTRQVVFVKDPAAVLDFSWDWTAWLAANDDDTISSSTIAIEERVPDEDEDPADIVELAAAAADEGGGVVTVFLSGGVLGSQLAVTCQVVTAGGRTDERSFRLLVAEA